MAHKSMLYTFGRNFFEVLETFLLLQAESSSTKRNGKTNNHDIC